MPETPLSPAIDHLFDLLLSAVSPDRFPASGGELQLALLIKARHLEHHGDREASKMLWKLAGEVEIQKSQHAR